MSVDVTQSLKDAENLLRSVIETRLSSSGENWIEECGVTQERIERWKSRKSAEESRLPAGKLDERLIYYADFYDLFSIIKRHWDKFSEVFGELKTLEVFLNELGKLRDPDAHRRELLPHQKHLAIGIAGELRTKMIQWRSKMETGDDCFPRIEAARDSLGSLFPPPHRIVLNVVQTGLTLRPGDNVDFSVTASDPFGEQLNYRIGLNGGPWGEWGTANDFTFAITEEHIGKLHLIVIQVRSGRSYHAESNYDDSVTFVYAVLPNRGQS